jgi:hypothetical protein
MEDQAPPQQQCPHLGILDDPNTSHSFPSTWNACFHARLPSVPTFEQQEKVCLTDGYVSCPVYQAAQGTVFPTDLLNTNKLSMQKQESKRNFIIIAGIILLFLLVAGVVASIAFKFPASLGSFVLGPNPVATNTTAMNVVLLVKITPTVELTVTPTPTIFVTITPTPKPVVLTPFPLETPFKIGEQDFLIYRVKDGDGLDILAKTYHTTSQVIQETNYLLKIPIWTDSLMLIRPDLTTLDSAEPSFEIYIVPDKLILIDDLAKRMNVDLAMLKYYNGCTNICVINRDHWILIPRHR